MDIFAPERLALAAALALCVWILWLEIKLKKQKHMMRIIRQGLDALADGKAELYRDDNDNIRIRSVK